ncbi:MAG: DinB family protein [Acidobacteriota bacterium]|nr:DinB family protein [Acidobacteriota bacterium]MDE3044741.1 DinB family protein [Acidobacteriota bacterium]MDE3107984.1 DinB family protein [Acidobacteriota bacterium]MDE3222338.1 DinB family protein [Acidobacteriota bacterium]
MNLQSRVNDYEAATHEVLRVFDEVTFERLDRHAEGSWSARQIIHHLADSETQSYLRLRRLIAEPTGSLIQGYDEGAWASNHTLGYEQLPVEHAMDVFRAVRRATLDVLRRLQERDLARYGEHSESGRYTLDLWLHIYTAHPRDHAEQLRQALAS